MGKHVCLGVEKLGRQHYRLWWTDPRDRLRRSKVVRCELPEAKARRRELLEKGDADARLGCPGMTLREYLGEWLDRRALLGARRLGENTIARYRALLASVIDGSGTVQGLGDRVLAELTKTDFETYYTDAVKHEVTRLGTLVSSDTVNKRHKVLRAALQAASEADPPLIVGNPVARAAHPPAARPGAQAWTSEEAFTFIAAVADTRFELLAIAGIHAGLRLSEALGLRRRDIILPAIGPGTLSVSGQIKESSSGLRWVPYAKTTASRRTISIGAELADAFRDQLRAIDARASELGVAWEDTGLVLCGTRGQVLRPSKMSNELSAIIAMLEDAGALSTTGATFHTTRHTHATLLLRQRVPVHVVSRRLGHSRIQITLDYYGHVIPQDDLEAALAMDALCVG